MKKILTTILALTMVVSAFAQTTTTEETDSTTVRVGKKSVTLGKNGITFDAEKKPKADNHFGGLGIGLNLLATRDGKVSLPKADQAWENEPIRSMTWNLNLYGTFIPITTDRHTFGLESGVGVTYRSFGFNEKDLDVVTDEKGTSLKANDEGLKYDKRKFRTTYLSVPLLLAFNSKIEEKRNFHFSAGLIGNLRIGSMYKRKYTQDGEIQKVKNRDDFNLNPLTLDATVRAGYGGWVFFFNYGLTSIFRDGKGPALIPMTFGVQIF